MRAPAAGWAQRVYECDKQVAAIGTTMQVNGFGFDSVRAAEMAAALRDVEVKARAKAEDAVGRSIRSTPTGGFAQLDLDDAFFKDLRAPMLIRSEITGKPSTGVEVLKAYINLPNPGLQALSLAVLEWRRARKLRKTYVENIKPGSDGRVHPTWLNYGTISGRFACKEPNIQNLPRPENDPTRTIFPGGLRSLYVPSPGNVLVVFDASQLEMRVAAYASGDAAMIAACESSDLHSANAEMLFGADFTHATDAGIKKALRTMAKSSGFATCYLAGDETVHERIVSSWQLSTPPPTLAMVRAMLAKLRKKLRRYYGWQSSELLQITRLGYVESPILGRRRWLGHEPLPTEAANFPIQGGAADLVNIRLTEITNNLAREYPRASLVAQVHDSAVFDTPEGLATQVLARCEEIFTAPIEIVSSGESFYPRFPIDGEIIGRWK